MQLTRFTDLGLRVLMYLTNTGRSEPVTIAEIASQFEAPHNHLIKVVNRLGKLGLVVATRGRSGGVRLAVDPYRIKLGNVLRQLEGHTELINCAEPPCALRGSCRLKAALDEGMEAFYRAMDRFNLAEMVDTPTGEKIIRLHRQFLAARH